MRPLKNVTLNNSPDFVKKWEKQLQRFQMLTVSQKYDIVKHIEKRRQTLCKTTRNHSQDIVAFGILKSVSFRKALIYLAFLSFFRNFAIKMAKILHLGMKNK